MEQKTQDRTKPGYATSTSSRLARLGRHQRKPSRACPRPRLITDFYAYNSGEVYGGSSNDSQLGQNWVGDLVLEATIHAQSSEGAVLLDLVRRGPALRDARSPWNRARRSSRSTTCPSFSRRPKRGSAARAGIAFRLPTSTGNCSCGSTASRSTSTPRLPTPPLATTFPLPTIWPGRHRFARGGAQGRTHSAETGRLLHCHQRGLWWHFRLFAGRLRSAT